jgi:hypothetical protein
MNYKVIIAPTKNINSSSVYFPKHTYPFFDEEAAILVEELKALNVEQLSKIMSISEDMALLNLKRFKNWKKIKGINEGYHAIQMYAGETFKAFDFMSLESALHEKLHESLFILSGLYGVLKPFDLIHPYRLEMGLKYKPLSRYQNLYQFWNDKLNVYFDQNLSKDDVLINLASQEYSKVLDFKKLSRRVIVPNFKEYKNGEYRMVMMYAKNARGKMARFVLENEMKGVEDLKFFDLDGYSFNENLSSENEWIFVR